MVRKDYSTLDFVIGESSTEIMAFLHVVYARIHMIEENPFFLRIFLFMKFKMKLSYDAWKNKLQLRPLII